MAGQGLDRLCLCVPALYADLLPYSAYMPCACHPPVCGATHHPIFLCLVCFPSFLLWVPGSLLSTCGGFPHCGYSYHYLLHPIITYHAFPIFTSLTLNEGGRFCLLLALPCSTQHHTPHTPFTYRFGSIPFCLYFEQGHFPFNSPLHRLSLVCSLQGHSHCLGTGWRQDLFRV